MNKSGEKNKVDKCPSTLENRVQDVHTNCISNESSQEQTEFNNGLTNGIGVGETIAVERSSRRTKRNKHKNSEAVDLRNQNEAEEKSIIKTVSTDIRNVDQSSKSKKNKFKSDNTVNSVDSNLKGNTKAEVRILDSNDNNSCDESTSCGPLNETEGVNQVAASSSKAMHSFDCYPKLKDLEPEITEACVSEVVDSLKNCNLEESPQGTSKDIELDVENPLNPKPIINFIQYESELQMPMIMKIIQKDLSEPYSIYTYRYFIHNWPKLCFLAMCEEDCVGAIVCKLDVHRKVIKRGYIAMLAVDQKYRKLRIGSNLVQMAINEMIHGDADEVVLETEVTNKPALQLYEKLGFVRDKRLFRYYLNGVDALRLKLWLR